MGLKSVVVLFVRQACHHLDRRMADVSEAQSLLSFICWTSPEVRSSKEKVTPLKPGYSSPKTANPENRIAAVCNLRGCTSHLANQQPVFDPPHGARQDQHSYRPCWSDLLKNVPATFVQQQWKRRSEQAPNRRSFADREM